MAEVVALLQPGMVDHRHPFDRQCLVTIAKVVNDAVDVGHFRSVMALQSVDSDAALNFLKKILINNDSLFIYFSFVF